MPNITGHTLYITLFFFRALGWYEKDYGGAAYDIDIWAEIHLVALKHTTASGSEQRCIFFGGGGGYRTFCFYFLVLSVLATFRYFSLFLATFFLAAFDSFQLLLAIVG